jgi:hypothetical protein
MSVNAGGRCGLGEVPQAPTEIMIPFALLEDWQIKHCSICDLFAYWTRALNRRRSIVLCTEPIHAEHVVL